MITKSILLTCALGIVTIASAQIDKEQLALLVSKSDAANMEQLHDYVWKRKTDVFIDGQLKLTTISEFSFNDEGKLDIILIDAETTVKQKPGLRGAAQQSAAEDKGEYVQRVLQLSIAYTFMSKGQLMDFFDKATITEKEQMYVVVGENVYVKGDKLTIWIDINTNLPLKKEFSSFLDNDAIDGLINYETFSTGVSHGSTTMLNMPAQRMKIDAMNKDYTKRVK